MADDQESHVLLIAERLAREFGQDRASVEAQVRAAYQRWSMAPVRAFVPIMVERRVRQELRSPDR